MRLHLVFALVFATTVLGQTSSFEPDMITVTADPEPAPETTSEPSSLPPTTETQFSITPSPEEPTISSTTSVPPLSTAAPPSGGGPTCVQRCLAQAASSVGCLSGADLVCLCSSNTYLSLARTCFTNSGCDDATSQGAVQDYGRACSATTTPVETSVPVSTRPTATSRTQVSNDESPTTTSLTTRTIAFTSGAVVSISRGVSSTITSGFTTVRTERAGDFATGGGGSAPTSGSDAGSANNGALGMNMGHLTSAGLMMGLAVVGGVAVLVF